MDTFGLIPHTQLPMLRSYLCVWRFQNAKYELLAIRWARDMLVASRFRLSGQVVIDHNMQRSIAITAHRSSSPKVFDGSSSLYVSLLEWVPISMVWEGEVVANHPLGALSDSGGQQAGEYLKSRHACDVVIATRSN